jgi:hypothetical protein
MDTIVALVIIGETVTVNGHILLLKEKLMEVPVNLHLASIIARTIVLTRMEITVIGNQLGLKKDLTLQTAVGGLAQVNTVHLVLGVQLQQGSGKKNVLILVTITRVLRKELSMKISPMLKKLLLCADVKEMKKLMLVSCLIY